MKKIQNVVLLFLVFLSFKSVAQSDTTEYAECYEAFFKTTTPIKNRATINLVLKNGKQRSLPGFLKDNYMEDSNELPIQIGLKDIDGNGSKELVLWNFTGGAHCCDVFYFFKNVSANKYSYAGELYAGNTCVGDDNNFVYNLHEHFGYFFTCFACGLEEKPDSFSYVYDLQVMYKNGKLQIKPGDESLKGKIKSNLAYIKSLGWDGGPDDGFDDGRRKEVALNLATYYFSFGKNLVATKSLFDTYYKFKDAAKVWKEFLGRLTEVKKSNGF